MPFPETIFTLNVELTHAPVNQNNEVPLSRTLGDKITKIGAVAGRANFMYESPELLLECRLGVVIANRAVKILPLQTKGQDAQAQNMFTVLWVQDDYRAEQAWVADGISGGVRPVSDPSNALVFINAMEERYSERDSLDPPPPSSTEWRRLTINTANVEPRSVFEATRPNVVAFAKYASILL